jgi:hypothetical protein
MLSVFKKTSSQASEPSAPPNEGRFMLRVMEGKAELFARVFPAGDYVVGSAAAADIVIPELDSDEAAIIRLEQVGLTSLITVSALAPNMVMARGRRLDIRQPANFPDRATFSIGAFTFTITYNNPKQAFAAPGSAPALLVAGAVLAGATAWMFGPSTPPAPKAPIAVPEQPAQPVAPHIHAQNLEADLRARLAAVNLLPPLRVSREQSIYIVSGSVNPDERVRAIDVMNAFRERTKAQVEMRMNSEADANSFIVAVALRPEIYVIGRDGRHYALKQRLPDGGVIEEIQENGVLIDRDGLRERIVYAR